jgi:hypothetical protein
LLSHFDLEGSERAVAEIGCSRDNCVENATQQVSIRVLSGRLEGEGLDVWMCRSHAQEVISAPKKPGLLRRFLGLSSA